MAGTAIAAPIKTGKVNGVKSSTEAFVIDFTADASAHTFPVYTFPTDFAPLVTDVSFVFDAVTPPDSLTYVVKDGYGATILASTTITASSVRGLLDVAVPLINGGTITLTGNTTNSAKVKVIVYILV